MKCEICKSEMVYGIEGEMPIWFCLICGHWFFAHVNAVIQREASYYQLVILNELELQKIQNKLTNSHLRSENIKQIDGKILVITDAPQNLGRILREFKNLALYNFKNTDFILIIEHLISKGYQVDNLDFLGAQNFNDDLYALLDHLSFSKNIGNLIDAVKENKIEITKFRARTSNNEIIFYRSGLIYSNFEILQLRPLLSSLLEITNVRNN